MVLHTDSSEYQFLAEAVKLTKDVPGNTIELGVRAGGGSEFIMRALALSNQYEKTHIAVDPWGNIMYQTHEDQFHKLDYTNQMRDQCMQDIYALAAKIGINLVVFVLEDTEFFKRFADGVPIYREFKTLGTAYSVVHFDGPHASEPLKAEIDFFKTRTPKGGIWVFDDIQHYYDHDAVEKDLIFPAGFSLVKKGQVKAMYAKD